MNKLDLYQKCLATIVVINDGRLDEMTLGQLYKVVNYFVTKDVFDVAGMTKQLAESTIEVKDIVYIADIIADLMKIEAE